jgi:hypothetical protein
MEFKLWTYSLFSSAIRKMKRFDSVLERYLTYCWRLKIILSSADEEEKITKAFVFAILRWLTNWLVITLNINILIK